MGNQISPIQGFTSASYFHVWHWNLGRWLEILSLESLWEGHGDAYDISRQSEFLDYLSYLIGWIRRISYRIVCSQAYCKLSTMAHPPIPSWLTSKATSLSQHLAKQGDNHVEDIMGFILLENPWQPNHINNNISKRLSLLKSGTHSISLERH